MLKISIIKHIMSDDVPISQLPVGAALGVLISWLLSEDFSSLLLWLCDLMLISLIAVYATYLISRVNCSMEERAYLIVTMAMSGLGGTILGNIVSVKVVVGMLLKLQKS